MDGIIVEHLLQKTTEEQDVEIVERKGKGHPDSICDAIVDHASVNLCREYQRLFARILHHNLDKAMLVAGVSRPMLGGGHVDQPMRMIFGDRAVTDYLGKTVDVPGILVGAAKEWIERNLHFVDPDLHVTFESAVAPGSSQLKALFEHNLIAANDTSAAVGFAPLSSTESTVLALEQHMNSVEFKRLFPDTGEDIKVMGVRQGRDLHLTIAVAFVDPFIASRQRYFQRIAADEGRLLASVKLKIDTAKVAQKALEVMRDIVPQEFSLRDVGGVERLIRIVPYRTTENRIEGVVLTVSDGSAEK